MLHLTRPDIPWYINGVGLVHLSWSGKPCSFIQEDHNEPEVLTELLCDHLQRSSETCNTKTFIQSGALDEGNATLQNQWSNGSRNAVYHSLKTGLQIPLIPFLSFCGRSQNGNYKAMRVSHCRSSKLLYTTFDEVLLHNILELVEPSSTIKID